MALRRICVHELTNINKTDSFTATCTNPGHTPSGTSDTPECNIALYNVAFTTNPTPTISFSYDAQFKYSYMQQGVTFDDFCFINNQSRLITFDSDITACDSGTAFTITSSASCDPAAITTTTTSVSAPLNFNFTLHNLCAQTILCIDDTTCL